MERLTLILEQIEESKRLILVGGVSQLRMALILLDNVAEILMHKKVQEEFGGSRLYENMLVSMLRIPRDEVSIQRKQEMDDFIKDLQANIISPVRKKKIQKYFDEKIKMFTEKGSLGKTHGQVLSVTHRYRNMAYHQEKIREETFRPIVLLLFEVVCDLLATFSIGCSTLVSGIDYSWFESRYGVSPWEANDEKGLSAYRLTCEGISL